MTKKTSSAWHFLVLHVIFLNSYHNKYLEQRCKKSWAGSCYFHNYVLSAYMLVLNTFFAGVVWNSKLWNFMQFHHGDQGGFHCGASTQANSILNYFISKFFKVPKFSLKLPKFPLKFSISSQPGWQAGTIKATPRKNFSQIPNPTSPQRDVCYTIL